MDCGTKFFFSLGKTALERVKLMKEVQKDKCFGEYNFLMTWGFQKRMFAELIKSGQPENIVNDRKVNVVWTFLQKNQQMTCKEKVASTNI